MNLQLQQLFYFSDNFSFGPSQLICNNTIGCLSGSAFQTLDIKTGKREYIWSQKNGFQCFSANYTRGLVVLAEYGLNPTIYIYQFPSKKLVATIKSKSQILDPSILQIVRLNISRDGKKFMIINGVPECNISIWDMDSHSQLGEIDIRTDLTFINARFSPKDNSLISVLYKETLQICTMQPYFIFQNDVPKDHNRFSIKEYNSKENHCMVWNEINLLYLASEGKVQVLDPINLEEIYMKKIDYNFKQMILTPKHLIAINSQNNFEFMLKYDKLYNDKDNTPFTVDKIYNFTQGEISLVQYSLDFHEIMVQTVEGCLYTLDIPAETYVEDEEDENDNNKNSKKRDNQIKCNCSLVIQYFTSGCVYVREFQNDDIIMAISSKGEVQLWNTKQRTLIHQFMVTGPVTCATLSQNDKLLVIGSDDSSIQIIDMKNLATLKIIRLYKKKKTIQSVEFGVGEFSNKLIVTSAESKKVFMFNITESQQSVMGYQSVVDRIISAQWHDSIIVVLVRSLLLSFTPPTQMNNISVPIFCRKIDPDLTHIVQNNATDLYLTGADKVLKRYKYPEEKLDKIDLKVKLPALSPTEEIEMHQLPITVIHHQKDTIISGSQDGEVQIRKTGKMLEFQRIKVLKQFQVMNFKYGGVQTLHYSERSQMIYVGGQDGSLILVQCGQPNFSKPITYQVPKIEENANVILHYYTEHYNIVMIQEKKQAQAKEREMLRNERHSQILQIQEKLKNILNQNDQAEEPDKLDRDEIVIDIKARDEIKQMGEFSQSKLKQDCEIQKMKYDIIYEKVKAATWDQMQVHLRSINGLQSESMIYNYHMRKEDPKEQLMIDKIVNIRRIQIREKLERPNQLDIINIDDIGKKLENYVVTAFPGKQVLVLNDYEKKDEVQEKTKGDAKRNQKKQNEKDEKVVQEQTLNLKPEQKKNIEEFTIWDYLYSAFDLFTNSRKTNQIYILKRIVQEIKKEFNKEFETMIVYRQNQVDQINERNKRIAEILVDLQKPVELFIPKKNYLDEYFNKLVLRQSYRFPTKKSLLRDISQKMKELNQSNSDQRKNRDQENWLQLIQDFINFQDDDSGQRALKDMMNNTLEVKKENILAESVQKEDWMNKPLEEMTDDEKIRLREYEIKEQKQNEEKEKIRKNLENELKKLRGEIQEICIKFDEKLHLFLKRKLEFDYRVAEQQLAIVKLVSAITTQSDNKIRNITLQGQIVNSEQQLNHQRELRDRLSKLKEQIDSDYKQNQENFNMQLDSKQKNLGFDVNKVRNIYVNVFEDFKKDEKKKLENEQKILNNPKYKQILIALDPYIDLEKNDIKLEEEQQFNSFHDEIIEKINNLQLDDENKKEQIIEQLNTKFNLKKSLEQTEIKRQRIFQYTQHFDRQINDKQAELSNVVQQKQNIIENLNKNLLNIEIQIRLKQGIVEVNQQNPISEEEVVLVSREVIEKKNEEIMTQGTNVIKQMKQISDTKLDVAKQEHELKIQDLKVREYELKTKEVQMLKVKKEMQQALTKKDTKLNEFELHNLQEQIEKVVQTTEKRIQIYKKKEEKINKDIEFIMKETEQLKMQGSSLDDTVKQRREISDMMFRKNQDQTGQRSDNENFEKFKKIQYNRKLYDLVKRQTEEIELLKEELQRLKLKTFADFSSVR